MAVRWAEPAEAAEVARLLHDFNTEFATPSPGVEVLTARLTELLPMGRTSALLAGDPAVAVALVEINVDEADVDAQRFYERHGFRSGDVAPDERAFSYSRELRQALGSEGP